MDQLLYGRIFGLPVWVVGLVVIGGAIAVYFIFFRNKASSSSTLGQNTEGQQAAVPAIDQSLYDPFTGAPLAAENAINPATGLPNYYNSSGNGTTGPTPPGTSVTTGAVGQPGPFGGTHLGIKDYPTGLTGQIGQPGTLTGTIRAAGSIPQYAAYDAGNPQGVPVDTSPGGQRQAFAGFGSQVQVTGPAVQGPSNLAGTGQQGGSNLWYPVAGGGYVSAADLQGAPHGGAAGPYQATDYWPIMMDMPVQRGR